MERAEFLTDVSKPTDAERVYIGEESCERLLMSDAQARSALETLGERGKAVSMVFPPLTDAGFEAASSILEAVRRDVPDGLEVVVNDYGLMEHAAETLPGTPVAVGRILSRVLARNVGEMAAYGSGEHERFCGFLRERGVSRFEFDPFTLGLVELRGLPFAVSLFHPYALVSFTRRCVTAKCGSDDESPFAGCTKQCRSMSFALEHTTLHGVFHLAGNCIMKKVGLPDKLDPQVDRLVLCAPPAIGPEPADAPEPGGKRRRSGKKKGGAGKLGAPRR